MNMKSMVNTMAVVVIIAFVMVAWICQAQSQPAAKADTNYDKELDKKITEVWSDCQKIHPGMTRADLDKMFRRDTGGVAVLDSTVLPFREHQTFDYRRCNHIMIDVDFRPSVSKDEQLTDVIIKVSKPYLDAAPRV